MNIRNRKVLQGLLNEIETAKSQIEDLKDDEQYKFDNMPESLQESERGEAWQDKIDALEEFISTIEEAIQSLEDAM